MGFSKKENLLANGNDTAPFLYLLLEDELPCCGCICCSVLFVHTFPGEYGVQHQKEVSVLQKHLWQVMTRLDFPPNTF